MNDFEKYKIFGDIHSLTRKLNIFLLMNNKAEHKELELIANYLKKKQNEYHKNKKKI